METKRKQDFDSKYDNISNYDKRITLFLKFRLICIFLFIHEKKSLHFGETPHSLMNGALLCNFVYWSTNILFSIDNRLGCIFCFCFRKIVDMLWAQASVSIMQFLCYSVLFCLPRLGLWEKPQKLICRYEFDWKELRSNDQTFDLWVSFNGTPLTYSCFLWIGLSISILIKRE